MITYKAVIGAGKTELNATARQIHKLHKLRGGDENTPNGIPGGPFRVDSFPSTHADKEGGHQNVQK